MSHLELLVRKYIEVHVRLSYPRPAAAEQETQRALDTTDEASYNSDDEALQATDPLSSERHLVRLVVFDFVVAW